jgi:hypothetical protein
MKHDLYGSVISGRTYYSAKYSTSLITHTFMYSTGVLFDNLQNPWASYHKFADKGGLSITSNLQYHLQYTTTTTNITTTTTAKLRASATITTTTTAKLRASATTATTTTTAKLRASATSNSIDSFSFLAWVEKLLHLL